LNKSKKFTFITIKVIANSSITKIEKLSQNSFKIWVNKPAVEGKANKELIKYLSLKFSIQQKDISIVKGETSSHKILKINGVSDHEIQSITSSL